MSQTQIDPRLRNQTWVEGIEATQVNLRRILKENKPSIKTHFSGEEERSIRKWLFRVTSKTMESTTPIEQVGRIVLTEFYPDVDVAPYHPPMTAIDPVLPIPLIDDLIGDDIFVNAFRKLYRLQQEYVKNRGPNGRYGREMLKAAGEIQHSSLDSLLDENERCYFWDKLFDVAAHPSEYLTVPKQTEFTTLHYIVLFLVTFFAVIGLLMLVS